MGWGAELAAIGGWLQELGGESSGALEKLFSEFSKAPVFPGTRVDLAEANSTLFAVRRRFGRAPVQSPLGNGPLKLNLASLPRAVFALLSLQLSDTSVQHRAELTVRHMSSTPHPKPDPPEHSESGKVFSDLGRYSGLGVHMVASMGVFGFGGYWLDGKFGTYPLLLIVGIFIGAGASFYSLLKTVSSATSASKAKSDSPKS
ncbi:MAG: ATP synthase protein I [Planctomycetota bacterium]